jgi:hypothetical protein
VSLRLARLPRVLALPEGTQVERQADFPDGADRIALMAQWSPDERLSLSTSRLIRELQEADYWVVVSSTSPAPGQLVPHVDGGVKLEDLTVLRRPNIGYDFGSWAVAMRHVEHLLGADKVLVVNDSLVGPFTSLKTVIADFEATSADVWGMVQSRQIIPHLQSFFRGFRYGSLLEPPMRRFWTDVRVIPDKLRLIAEYEYGFTPWLQREGFSSACFVHADDVVWGEHNPTIHGWQRLLEAGVPFVKRELLRRPDLAPDGHLIPDHLAERYGVEVSAWW